MGLFDQEKWALIHFLNIRAALISFKACTNSKSVMGLNSKIKKKLKNIISIKPKKKHIEKVLKHKDLEIELANAKFQQSELKLSESSERSKAEKKIVSTLKECVKCFIFFH